MKFIVTNGPNTKFLRNDDRQNKVFVSTDNILQATTYDTVDEADKARIASQFRFTYNVRMLSDS